MINLFIGVDRYEMQAFHVAAHSAMRHCSVPISITPLYKHNLTKYMIRERDPKQSTDFAFSRFLVPYLSGYTGMSIFMDCDVLIKCDLMEIMRHCQNDPLRSVWCVKHAYEPKNERKFLGQEQTSYEKKNWSSVMVFNNSLCEQLTPEYANTVTGLDLHQFKWLENEHLIGQLPLTYNWLVGEYAKNHNAKILHYTLGTPCFNGYENCDHSDEWWEESDLMNSCVQRVDREVKV